MTVKISGCEKDFFFFLQTLWMVLQIKLLLDQENRKKKPQQVFASIPNNG